MSIQQASRATRSAAHARKFAGLLVPGMSEIRQHRPIVAPMAGAWLLSMASAYALRPFVVAALPEEQARYAEALVWLGAVAGPVLNGLKALAFTALAWAVLVLTSTDRSVRPIFSLLLYGEAILAAQGVVMAVFLRFTTDGAVASPQELQTGFGLAALVPATRPALAAAAQNLTLLHLAWFAFLCTGFRRVVELGPWSSTGLAATYWFVLVGLGLARFLVV